MKRRDVLRQAVAASAGVLVGVATDVHSASTSAPRKDAKNFLLVHGAWHNSLHWNKVMALLAANGHDVLAIDLPGYGLNARFPDSFLTQNLTQLKVEASKVANITLQDYTDAIVEAMTRIAPRGAITLVGHSASGVATTRAAETAPELLGRIVYLTAYCPVDLPSMGAYAMSPEGSSATVGKVLMGDPGHTDAFRINPHAQNVEYLVAAQEAFYNDMTFDECLPYLNALTPDFPLKAGIADGRGTAARWGKVPRTFIRCLQDHALPLALQDRMIAEADRLTPTNRFDVHTLDSSHSAFASMPEKVADILGSLA
jgi:pimeloyl-ACP methyl ester carboxylesterase